MGTRHRMFDLPRAGDELLVNRGWDMRFPVALPFRESDDPDEQGGYGQYHGPRGQGVFPSSTLEHPR